MEQLLLYKSLPLWIMLFLYFGNMLYKDILKPYSDRRTNQLLEIEKENKLIKKFNEDLAWKNNLMNILTSKEVNRLSFETFRIYVINAFEVSRDKLNLEIKDVFKRNDIKNIVRQNQIKLQLISFLQYEKNRVTSMFELIQFQEVKASLYFKSISEKHTNDFVLQITEIMFNENEFEKKQIDLDYIIDFHYKTHINDCLSFVKKD